MWGGLKPTPRGGYLAGAVVVAGAGVAVEAACFLCFFTLLVAGLVVSVEEAAGVCAITVPIMRERPIKAEAKVFMVFVSFLDAVIRLP